MAMPVAELLFGGVQGDDEDGRATDRRVRMHATVPSSDIDIDADLFARLRRGDPNVAELIFRAQYLPLVRYAVRFCDSADVAEDLVQDALADFLMRRWEDEEAVRSVTALLRTMVRRRALNLWKHTHVVARSAALVEEHDSARTAELPDAMLERAETIAAVRIAFQQLPPRARLIATMRWSDHLGRREIAAELGISVRTVDAQLYLVADRIRESLREFR
jgi:RNA polymerase sigma-70 factor (ECF subfamily)